MMVSMTRWNHAIASEGSRPSAGLQTDPTEDACLDLRALVIESGTAFVESASGWPQ